MVTLNKPSAGATDWATSINDNWTTLEGAFKLELIETITASNVATVDFDSGIDSTYRDYLITISDMVCATDGTELLVRVSDDGGATWEADAGDYRWSDWRWNETGGSINTGSASATEMNLMTTAALGNDTGEALSGWIKFFNPSGSSRSKYFLWFIVFRSNEGKLTVVTGGGCLNATTAIQGVRFLMSSGNISSGTFKLYGLK